MRSGEVIEGDLVFPDPLSVGPAGGESGLDLLVGDDAAFGEVGKEHPAGLEAALELYFFGGDGEDAGFRSHDEQIIVGDEVARGAEAVAVERGSDDAAVGEGDGGGAVPGLDEGGVIFVEGALFGGHGGVAIPGFGDEHGHHVGEFAAAEVEHFDGVVGLGGIRAAGHADGEDFLEAVAE